MEHCKEQRIAQKENAWSCLKADNEKPLSVNSGTYGNFISPVLLVSSDRKLNPIGLKERKGFYWLL